MLRVVQQNTWSLSRTCYSMLFMGLPVKDVKMRIGNTLGVYIRLCYGQKEWC